MSKAKEPPGKWEIRILSRDPDTGTFAILGKTRKVQGHRLLHFGIRPADKENGEGTGWRVDHVPTGYSIHNTWGNLRSLGAAREFVMKLYEIKGAGSEAGEPPVWASDKPGELRKYGDQVHDLLLRLGALRKK